MITTYAPAANPAPQDDRRTTPYPGDDDALVFVGQLATAGHACCCSAQPAVVAVLPATPDRPHPTEVLLCGHHYRRSQARLDAADARVFDANGVRVLTHGEPYFPTPHAATSGAL